jgi:hypothetical protein
VESVVLVGDLGDPWSGLIAARLGVGSRRIDRESATSALEAEDLRRARLLVLHATVPTRRDLELVAQARAASVPRIVFCTGMTSRYHQLEPFAAQCDVMMHETTAIAAIDRQLAIVNGSGWGEQALPVPEIAVVSTNFEMRMMLAEAAARGGFHARPVRGWSEVSPSQPAVWDVAVLEDDWSRVIARESQQRAVVALSGFLDRCIVEEMRARGARCALDLPCDPADLRWVLRRELQAGQRARA